MTTPNGNLAALKQAYRKWNDEKGRRGDMWLDLLDDRVRFRSVGQAQPGLSFARDRNSREEVVGYLQGLTGEWEMVHWTPEQFVCEDDRIAMFGVCAWTNRKSGKIAEVRVAHLWQFKDSKIVALNEIYDTGAAAAAAA